MYHQYVKSMFSSYGTRKLKRRIECGEYRVRAARETMYGRRIAGGKRWNERKRDGAWKCERDPKREQRAWQERGCRGAGLRPDWPYLDAPAAFGALSSPTPRTLTLTLSLRGWMEGGPAHFSRPTWLHVLIGCRPLALTSLPLAASDTGGVDGRVPSTWLLFPEKKSRRDGREDPDVNRSSIDSLFVVYQPAKFNGFSQSSFIWRVEEIKIVFYRNETYIR